MLKLRLCILIALLLALVCCGGVVAGPKHPNYGDPDIYEGVRTNNGPLLDQLGVPDEPDLVIEIPWLGRIVIKRQEQDYHLRKTAERLPAASETVITAR
jgi:hypothetical protein